MTHSFSQDFVNGLKCRCPKCGEGKLFKSYLKVVDQCPACHEEFHHHRADDLPAYFVILIVGHIVVTAATAVETSFIPPYWVHLALWIPITVILSLLLLQPVKGAAVAIQWRMGMHGFKKSKDLRDEQP